MRILALTVMLLAVLGVVGVAVTAVAGDEAEAVPAKTIASESPPADAMPARPLLPMPTATPTDSAGGTSPLQQASSDAPVMIAAIYWLLLAGVALRRVAAQRHELVI